MKQKLIELNGEKRRATRHLYRLCLLPLFMVVGWAGCKQPAKVVAETDSVGTYALVSVDGNKVPCTLQHEGHTLTIKSGSFIISPEGTCNSRVVFSPPSGGDTTRDVKATYTRQGSELTMKWERAGVTIGTVEGDTFTMENEGQILLYQKTH